MTESVRTTLRPSRPWRCLAGLTVAAGLLVAGSGCAVDPLRDPMVLASPAPGVEVWAVAPLTNESGTTLVDSLKTADAVFAEMQSIDGVDAVPVNRTVAAMRTLRLPAIESAHDAQAVIRLLGVDALVVGTITTWDPYRPMTIGMALELYRRDEPLGARVDPYELGQSLAGAPSLGAVGPPPPIARAAQVFDAADHRVLKWLRDYADARHAPDNPLGPDLYRVSMDRYTRFAAYHLLGSILAQERIRTTGSIEVARAAPRRHDTADTTLGPIP